MRKPPLSNDVKTGTRVTGSSPTAKRLNRSLRTVAKSHRQVLLIGDVGAGKEYAARVIHQLWAQGRRHPFIAVNCSALGYTIDEQALCGRKGDELDQRQRAGWLARARGGTLFLANIEDTPAGFQELLLRTLNDAGGGGRNGRTSLISASCSDLAVKVEAGRFLPGLFNLLAPQVIQIPSLSARIQDVPELVLCFLQEYCAETERPIPAVPADIFQTMMEYSWRGNVGELKDCVRTLVLMSPANELSSKYIPFEVRRHPLDSLVVLNLNETVAEIEQYLIRKALHRFAGNQVKAAELLEIPEATLRFKIKKYSIPRDV